MKNTTTKMWEPLQRRRPKPAKTQLWLTTLIALATAPTAFATPETPPVWNGKTAPLATPWTSEVSLKHALPESPRPQLARPSLDHPQWMSLNGLWQYTATDGKGTPPFGQSLN